MKQLFKWGGAALIISALVLMLGACPGWGTDDDDDDKDNPSGVDFKNYTTDSTQAFMVRNNTSVKLVAFKGSLAAETILGGIPAGAQNHGIKKNPSLFSTTQSFSMILITEEDYNKNKSNLAVLEQTPFTRVYVYYNASGDNTVLYDISSRLGGTNVIEIGNNSNLNVEIRLGGINGATIGYAPSGMLVTKLFVDDGDFNLFPVFKRYNALRDVVDTIYPKFEDGKPYYKPLALEGGTLRWNINEALESIQAVSTGTAMLNIVNNTNGAIHLMKGNTVVRSSTGISYFNATTSKVFTIEMASVPGANQTFATSQQVSQYLVGPDTNEKAIQDESGNTTFTVLTDYMYTVNVTGQLGSTSNPIKAVIYLDVNSTDAYKPVPYTIDEVLTAN